MKVQVGGIWVTVVFIFSWNQIHNPWPQKDFTFQGIYVGWRIPNKTFHPFTLYLGAGYKNLKIIKKPSNPVGSRFESNRLILQQPTENYPYLLPSFGPNQVITRNILNTGSELNTYIHFMRSCLENASIFSDCLQFVKKRTIWFWIYGEAKLNNSY